jgi:hypothetical protein
VETLLCYSFDSTPKTCVSIFDFVNIFATEMAENVGNSDFKVQQFITKIKNKHIAFRKIAAEK